MAEEEKSSNGEEEYFSSLSAYEILITGGSVVCMNVGRCAVYGVVQALKGMFGVTLEKQPVLESESVTPPARIYIDKNAYGGLMILKHEQVRGSGFIIVTLTRQVAMNLMAKTGVLTRPTEQEILDGCGEFCNLIAGTFKMEFNRLNLGLIKIGIPKTYGNGADEVIPDVSVDMKYVLNITHQRVFLLRAEIAFKSENM